jgi:hypothetical protein
LLILTRFSPNVKDDYDDSDNYSNEREGEYGYYSDYEEPMKGGGEDDEDEDEEDDPDDYYDSQEEYDDDDHAYEHRPSNREPDPGPPSGEDPAGEFDDFPRPFDMFWLVLLAGIAYLFVRDVKDDLKTKNAAGNGTILERASEDFLEATETVEDALQLREPANAQSNASEFSETHPGANNTTQEYSGVTSVDESDSETAGVFETTPANSTFTTDLLVLPVISRALAIIPDTCPAAETVALARSITLSVSQTVAFTWDYVLGAITAVAIVVVLLALLAKFFMEAGKGKEIFDGHNPSDSSGSSDADKLQSQDLSDFRNPSQTTEGSSTVVENQDSQMSSQTAAVYEDQDFQDDSKTLIHSVSLVP